MIRQLAEKGILPQKNKMSAQDEVIKELVEKTFREISQTSKPRSDSREWKDPEGYKYLTSWSNSVLLRHFVRLFTNSLPKNEYRRKAQYDDSARSVVRNQEEGFKRPTTMEYLQFLGYSQASLEEVKGDTRELTDDGFLQSIPGSSLSSIGINLKDFNSALRNFRGDYRNLRDDKGKKDFLYQPLDILYPPLKNIRVQDLTYEIFLELINKTDFLLRKLVESLEKKLAFERKTYLVGQERIKDKLKR